MLLSRCGCEKSTRLAETAMNTASNCSDLHKAIDGKPIMTDTHESECNEPSDGLSRISGAEYRSSGNKLMRPCLSEQFSIFKIDTAVY